MSDTFRSIQRNEGMAPTLVCNSGNKSHQVGLTQIVSYNTEGSPPPHVNIQYLSHVNETFFSTVSSICTPGLKTSTGNCQTQCDTNTWSSQHHNRSLPQQKPVI